MAFPFGVVSGLVLFITISLRADDANVLQRLTGNWKAVSGQRDGKDAADISGHVLTLRNNTFAIRLGDKTLYQGTFKIETGKKPNQIDFLHEQGELKGKQWLGIMKWDGMDSLTICDNGADFQKPRPEGFESRPGSGSVLVKFTRQ